MTIHLGYVAANSTLYIPFHTFNSSGASVTISGLATTDIEIYKNGSVTQRSSDNGYALLDTDGIDFDGLTGIHGFSIDLSDNTDAGFYSAGGFFWVVVSSITADSQTVSFVAATFWIGPAEANVSQFGGTAGTFASGIPAVNATQISGDSTAADNLETAFDDTAGAVPWQFISHQGTLQSVGSTTEVTIAASASAENDVYIGHTIHFVSGTTGVKQSALISDYVGSTKVTTLAAAVPIALTGTITYKIVATAPSTATTPPTAAAIADAVWDEATSGHTTSGTFGEQCKTDIDAILADTDVIGATGAGLTSLATQASVNTIDDFLDTEMAAVLAAVDTEVAAIKAKTDQLTFTVANVIDANVQNINDVAITGDGSGTPFDV